MANILIVDDDRVFCDVLSRAIDRIGLSSTFSLTLGEGLREAASRAYEVVLLDVQLPDGNGLGAIEKIRRMPSQPEVIIITGSGDPDGAELAIRWGAWDYVEKPASTGEITLPVLRALEYRKEKQAKSQLASLNRRGIIGDSHKMLRCLDLLAQAAASDVNVLITGETGTGKELFARALHENSERAKMPFVVVDCGALPASLVEGLLFGHEKGSFTGADKRRTGLIRQAHGGTLFLDEVGELPFALQKAFLRVLQEQRFRPLGSKSEEASDFRLVAATNRDLEQMVGSGSFRNDLLFRIKTFVIDLPPLRERTEDIMELAMRHMAKSCERLRMMTKGFSPEFFEFLQAYDWPGNVRELFNTIHSALAVAQDEPILFPNHLPVHVRAKAARGFIEKRGNSLFEKEAVPSEEPLAPEHLPRFKEYRKVLLEKGERGYFNRIAKLANGDIREACRISGLSRSRIYHFLKKHSVSLT